MEDRLSRLESQVRTMRVVSGALVLAVLGAFAAGWAMGGPGDAEFDKLTARDLVIVDEDGNTVFSVGKDGNVGAHKFSIVDRDGRLCGGMGYTADGATLVLCDAEDPADNNITMVARGSDSGSSWIYLSHTTGDQGAVVGMRADDTGAGLVGTSGIEEQILNGVRPGALPATFRSPDKPIYFKHAGQ